MNNSFINKLSKNKQFYHKMATALSKNQTNIKDGYDVLHDVIVEHLETGEPWKTCKRRVKSFISNHDVRDQNDNYINNHYIRPNLSRRMYPSFNMDACRFFDKLNDIIYWHGYPKGFHATNGGEKKISYFYVDFFIPEYGIVIEYNEKEHYWSDRKKSYDKWRRYEIEKIINMPIIIVHDESETPDHIARMVISQIEYSAEKNFYKNGVK